jgi:hypothetical protein
MVDVYVDSHNILKRWKSYFCQLLNLYGFNDVRETEMLTAESLVPEPSYLKLEIATEELKRYKSSGTDQIQAEFIQAGGNTYSENHKLINST